MQLSKLNMISNQILPEGGQDPRIIDAFACIEREIFIDEKYKDIAYSDAAIPLSDDRELLSPSMLSQLLHLANIQERDTVLNIACGTGYSTAIISKLAKQVVGVESNTTLASKANSLTSKMGLNNTIIINNDLVTGHPDGGPYDVILILGAIGTLPQSLTKQVKPNGKIITALHQPSGYDHITVYTKNASQVIGETFFETKLPKLSEMA